MLPQVDDSSSYGLEDLDTVESAILSSYAAGLDAKDIPEHEIDAAYRLPSAIHFGLVLGEDAVKPAHRTARDDRDDPNLRFSVAFGTRALRNALAL